MANLTWTDQQIDHAAKLWREGLSASHIANSVGASRSAVLGMMYRNRDLFPKRGQGGNGMVRAEANKAILPGRNERARLKPAGRPVRPQHSQQARERADKAARLAEERNRDITPAKIPFSDLEPGQCKWPLDLSMGVPGSEGMICCGLPVAKPDAIDGRREKTHCPHHLARSIGAHSIGLSRRSVDELAGGAG